MQILNDLGFFLKKEEIVFENIIHSERVNCSIKLEMKCSIDSCNLSFDILCDEDD